MNRGGEKTPRRGARVRHSKRRSLNRVSQEVVSHFVRTLARCGSSPQDILNAVRIACEEVPESWTNHAREAAREIADASHVLTVWFSNVEYLDGAGKPLPLPLRGRSKSIGTLIRSINPGLDAREVLAYLVRHGAVDHRGGRYVPRARSLLLRGGHGPDYFRALRVLGNTLATLEHNVFEKSATPSWFEYIAENPRFPVAARPALDKYINRLGKELLARVDARMHQSEVERKPGEPTVRVGIGMQLWEGEARARPRRKRAGVRSVRRRRK
jgi:hypothetical protein